MRSAHASGDRVLHRGVYYWPTYATAHSHVTEKGLAVARIRDFDLGWAVQIKVGGAYLGPEVAA